MRMISRPELEFLSELSRQSGIDLFSLGLSSSVSVESLKDGGMGSIRFEIENKDAKYRKFGKSVIEGEFDDLDGVLVSFAVNVDSDGQLFELDLWRVDFEPLLQFPTSTNPLQIRRSAN
jgi:hypothetical protein